MKKSEAMSIISAATLREWQRSQQAHILLFTTKDGSGPGVRPDISKQHPHTYIPNSIFFDLENTFSDTKSKLSTTMISPEAFARSASLLGVKNTDTIVVYDDYGNFYASRLWFMFKSMGHKNVVVLDGGLPLWLDAGYDTCNKLKTDIGHTHYTAQSDLSFQFVDKSFVLDVVRQNELGNHDTLILDARGERRFKGLEAESREGLRSGHIPYSRSLHYASLQGRYGQFLDIAALSALFEAYSQRQLVFTCGSGVTACILAQAADFLGYSNLKVYDGSWSQWGADSNLPIETS